MIQGGLTDEYVRDELKIDAVSVRHKLVRTIEELNKVTHVRPNTIFGEAVTVEPLVANTLEALKKLMDTVEHCRFEIMMAVNEAVIDETTEEILRESIRSIDEIATHHSIEEVYVGSVETVSIDAYYVWYRATGKIAAELQWGSNSDLRRGDAAVLDHSFPFICDISAFVENPKDLLTDSIELHVDDGGWSQAFEPTEP